MSTKLTYTGAEVQELLDKIEKGDFDNAKTLEGHPASYFAIASEFTSLAESFATEQGRVDTLHSYFNNGSANDALSLGGQLPSYYATATQYEILQQTLTDFKSLFDSMFEKDSEGNIHAKLSLWSSGGITAGGVGSGSSGGGGISYNRLDSWADYSADKSGWVLSALLGKDLDSRVSALANAGYITQSALAPYALRSEIPSLDGYFLASNFNQANIKTTLGISDWALARVKPTYTASEVGALAQDSSGANADLDTILDSKTAVLKPFFQVLTNNNVGSARKGVLRMSYNGSESQLLFDHYNRLLRYRTIGENPKDWATIAFTSDIPTKLSQLTDDVVAGKYLSLTGGKVNGSIYMNGYFLLGNSQPIMVADTDGVYQSALYLSTGNNFLIGYGTSVVGKRRTCLFGKIIEFKSNGGEDSTLVLNADRTATFSSTVSAPSFIGNLTGTADKASTQTVLYSNRDVNLWDIGNRTARYFALDDTAQNTPSGAYALGSILMEYSWDTNAGAQLLSHNRGNNIFYRSRWNGAFKDWREIAFTDSNVASATKLATPRTIWGQSFDGTGDITGALTAPSITTNSLTIGGITLTYDSVNEALCINGNMYALGGITAGGAGISAYTSLETRVARLEQQLNIS